MTQASDTPVVDARKHIYETEGTFIRPIELVGSEYTCFGSEYSPLEELNAPLGWDHHLVDLEPNSVGQITTADLLDLPVPVGTIRR
jgi:hypothetical protein